MPSYHPSNDQSPEQKSSKASNQNPDRHHCRPISMYVCTRNQSTNQPTNQSANRSINQSKTPQPTLESNQSIQHEVESRKSTVESTRKPAHLPNHAYSGENAHKAHSCKGKPALEKCLRRKPTGARAPSTRNSSLYYY